MSSRVAVAERFASLKKQASGARLNLQKGSPRAEVALTIPVEELRQLLRTDVKAVVKAELEAAKFPRPNGRQRLAGRSAHGRRRSSQTGDNDNEPIEATASPWDLGGADDLGSQGQLIPMEVGKWSASDVLPERRSSSKEEGSSWFRRSSPEKDNPTYELLLTDDVDETFESQASTALPNMGCCMKNAISIAETLSTVKDDFEAVLETGKLGTYFRFLGIDPIWSKKNLPLLFERVKEEQHLMEGEDENAEGIETTTFVERCLALRGNARSTEIMDLHDVVAKLQLTQELILEQLQQDDSRQRAQRLQEEHLDDVHGDDLDPL
jgi:hypothetical protein